MTTIEWTDQTWNPTRGCTRVSSGCEHCYAERVARRHTYPGGPYEGLLGTLSGRWNGQIRLVPEKLEEPLRWRKPRRVFVDSMSDLFHEGVPDDYIDAVLAVAALTPQHTYQVLTKRAERMRQYVSSPGRRSEIALKASRQAERRAFEGHPLPRPATWVESDDGDEVRVAAVSFRWPLPNVWLGVSVEDQATADERVPLLLETPAAIRFLSCEPLLGPIDLHGRRWLSSHRRLSRVVRTRLWSRAIDWVIVGGESGPGARPGETEWIRSIVKQCWWEADAACFVKQLGAHWSREHGARSRAGADPAEWPEVLRVREFPVS